MTPRWALAWVPDEAERALLFDMLEKEGLAPAPVMSPEALVMQLDETAAVVIADLGELTDAGRDLIANAVRQQADWSEIPFLFIGTPGGAEQAVQAHEAAGNALFFHRPLVAHALTAAIRSASRSRQRQWEVRDCRAALAANVNTLSFALEAGRLGAWDYDPRANRLEGSSHFQPIFGMPAEAPITHAGLVDRLHPEDRKAVIAAVNHSLQSGEPLDLETRVRASDEGVRHVEIRGRVLERGTDGRHLAGVVMDVTAQARSREELAARVAARTAELEAAMEQREMAEAALRQSQKMEAVGQLTGGVAHDFNNLLQVISGGLQLLEKGGPPERRQRLLEAMRQATERGAQLTRQLLAFSRRQELRPELVDLGQQLTNMRELLQRSLRGDIRIRLSVAADVWPVQVDPIQLELAILNLAVNARDAMPGGGVLTISANNVAGWRDGAMSGDFVRLAVEDTGVGMSPEVQARAFEPFFTTKEVGSGTGLGLPQVYGFAAQSHGTVQIDSVPGEGTTVALMLPRASHEAAPRQPVVRQARIPAGEPAGDLPRAAPGTTVLLVEDDDRVAELAAEMLLQLGYGYTRVRTGHAALAVLAGGQRVDVVFSDVLMPGGMNGAELAEELRRRRPGLPVVLATGFDGQAIAEARAEDLPLLRKPYRLDTLAHALQASMRSR